MHRGSPILRRLTAVGTDQVELGRRAAEILHQIRNFERPWTTTNKS